MTGNASFQNKSGSISCLTNKFLPVPVPLPHATEEEAEIKETQ